ncbi:MAG TPA: hypothetical protein VD738_11500 [Nitrospira sp.]|jgi:hypothetical protein|nr:hypothetical protein [Nitrospira sp.]
MKRLPISFIGAASFACGLALLLVTMSACASKDVRYPEDHERIRRIDRAVESLRVAYQQKDRAAFQSLMLPMDQLESLQRHAEADFDAYHTITLEFTIERILVEDDDIDVFVHWQGLWKKDAGDAGLRQRGHARLQWVGTQAILLRGVQGDLPFGMKTKEALSDALPVQPAP